MGAEGPVQKAARESILVRRLPAVRMCWEAGSA
jgi:hypothetical protein